MAERGLPDRAFMPLLVIVGLMAVDLIGAAGVAAPQDLGRMPRSTKSSTSPTQWAYSTLMTISSTSLSQYAGIEISSGTASSLVARNTAMRVPSEMTREA